MEKESKIFSFLYFWTLTKQENWNRFHFSPLISLYQTPPKFLPWILILGSLRDNSPRDNDIGLNSISLHMAEYKEDEDDDKPGGRWRRCLRRRLRVSTGRVFTGEKGF